MFIQMILMFVFIPFMLIRMFVLSAMPSKENSQRNHFRTQLSTTIHYGNKIIHCKVYIYRPLNKSEMNEEGIKKYLGDNLLDVGKEALCNGKQHIYYVDGIKVVLTP